MSDAPPFDQLSEGQKVCLRLVSQGYETKEIAPLVGLSIDGVNARLKAAMKILSASRRSEAARLLAVHEGLYQQRVHPPLVVAKSDEAGPPALASEPGVQEADGGRRLSIAEERVPYGSPTKRRHWQLRWPFPTAGRETNDLTMIEGLVWILVGSAILTIAAATILNAYSTLTALWRSAP